MLWYHWTFFGMHFFWWLAWIALIIAFLSTMASASRRTVRLRHDEALGILQRRYAAGEITTQEYEERKRVIERVCASRYRGGWSRGRGTGTRPRKSRRAVVGAGETSKSDIGTSAAKLAQT